MEKTIRLLLFYTILVNKSWQLENNTENSINRTLSDVLHLSKSQNEFNQSRILINSNNNNSNNNNSINNNNLTLTPNINNLSPISKLPVKFVNKPQFGKKIIDKKSMIFDTDIEWKCPNISRNQNVECGCDLPHTLRCSGNLHGLEIIANGLRQSKYSVSLLDCTLKNVTFLSDARIFENVSLHGLVISSGEIKRVNRLTFVGLKIPLQALGLPNNALLNIPFTALAPLTSLDRLDLSNNRIKVLGNVEFSALTKLSYLELSENQISNISIRAFAPLKKLLTLKLNGNRLGDYASTLLTLGQCINLRELNLEANSIKGPLSNNTLPSIPALESLNLDRNLLTSIQNGALEAFSYLATLSIRHNQIDVLQDHAFSGLGSLQVLNLGHNGIVAVSGQSLQHLPKLLELDLTHNFLRALTSDLIAPLPSLRELHLDGNDISIIANNALENVNELQSLSLQDNPLSCDCSLISFAEWLLQSKLQSQDLLGAVCATPRHLEGASLFQVPLESLKCGSNDEEIDTSKFLEQLEDNTNPTNLSNIKDYSDVIILRNLYFSSDNDLTLTWSINLKNNEFKCDAIFVYQESNMHEILLDNSPIHCRVNVIDDEKIVTVILQDSSNLEIGESYRFCIVLLQEKNIKSNLIVGCSNITKLDGNHQIQTNTQKQQTLSDISTFDKISFNNEEFLTQQQKDFNKKNISDIKNNSLNKKWEQQIDQDNRDKTFDIINNMNKSFLPGLGLGIIITSIFILLWAATKLRNDRPQRATVTTCYTTTNSINPIDIESRNRYVKLQATTSL